MCSLTYIPMMLREMMWIHSTWALQNRIMAGSKVFSTATALKVSIAGRIGCDCIFHIFIDYCFCEGAFGQNDDGEIKHLDMECPMY